MNAQPNLGMQVTTFENPMGIDGFEFVEFAAPKGRAGELHDLFKCMGFTAVLRHKARPITVYRQNGVNFLLNEDPDSFAADFAKAHGPSACGFAIRFKQDAPTVLATVLGNGGEPIEHKEASKAVAAPVVKGIGDCMLYLVDRYGSKGSVYDADFAPIEGAEQNPAGFGLTFIDHLTHNLHFGNMQKWSDYYERLFNFREIRYFDIKGAKTGLVSKAMTAPDGIVRIPLNESNDPKSQINEYLDAYKGEGIQHIACFTDDIYATVEKMRAAGVEFLDTPDAYFEVID
ncbi:MAG TPA: VOC family protein, partial [Rhodanobacter sp.]|nr:VOC family protein [Rhodanobacter sp.]